MFALKLQRKRTGGFFILCQLLHNSKKLAIFVQAFTPTLPILLSFSPTSLQIPLFSNYSCGAKMIEQLTLKIQL